jgi:IclR-like helix-turn-helix domain-containing protein
MRQVSAGGATRCAKSAMMANMPEERESHYVQSLARGLSVISALIIAFGPDSRELSLSHVARARGLRRAAARWFLLTLVDLGHVRQDGKWGIHTDLARTQ